MRMGEQQRIRTKLSLKKSKKKSGYSKEKARKIYLEKKKRIEAARRF